MVRLHGDVSNVSEGLQKLSLSSSSTSIEQGEIFDRATPTCGLSCFSRLLSQARGTEDLQILVHAFTMFDSNVNADSMHMML